MAVRLFSAAQSGAFLSDSTSPAHPHVLNGCRPGIFGRPRQDVRFFPFCMLILLDFASLLSSVRALLVIFFARIANLGTRVGRS